MSILPLHVVSILLDLLLHGVLPPLDLQIDFVLLDLLILLGKFLEDLPMIDVLGFVLGGPIEGTCHIQANDPCGYRKGDR
jgi:hypothetical protein